MHKMQSAAEVHHALKAALQSMAEAEKCAVICFGEIMERKLYRELGFSSINQYAEEELGFSTSRTRDFIMLCKRLKKLPLMKKKIESGKLGYTSARVLAPVVDQSNEEDWLKYAENKSRRELEKEVKRAKVEATAPPTLLPVRTQRPAAVVPVRVSLEMTPTQFAQYEAAWERIRKQGDLPADQVEALLAIMQSFSGEKGPRGPLHAETKPPVQIHIHHCPECEQASVQTSRGELAIGKAELEQAQCDCQTSRPGERNATSIPPKTRREVIAQYRNKCQRPGCNHTRYLQVHHKIPRSQGGTNAPENLTLLCQSCHSLHHKGFFVKSPGSVYKWNSGALNAQLGP